MPSMLTLHRRHSAACPHATKGRKWNRCKCPLHVSGIMEGVRVRKALQTRNWQRATEIVREWEACGVPGQTDDISLEAARDDFLEDLVRQKRSATTERKYRIIFSRLEAFAGDHGITHLKQFSLPLLRKCVATWPDAPLTQQKNIERLRCLFRYAMESGWVESNPAKGVKAPAVKDKPTLPFTEPEMIDIIAACDRFPSQQVRRGLSVRSRIKALVLLMRYSGLRITDAVMLAVGKIQGNRLILYTQKTGVPVFTVLPDFVVTALDECPRSHPSYFFWTGQGSAESTRKYWDKKLRTLFETAGITGGHSHRFRDTFAVGLLMAGVPLDRLSVLLGHSSVKTTERHYSPWVQSRQTQLEADLARAWAQDPVCQTQRLARIEGDVQ